MFYIAYHAESLGEFEFEKRTCNHSFDMAGASKVIDILLSGRSTGKEERGLRTDL